MSIRIILGVFCVLHGLVHLLYFGQSARYFELQPGLSWPNGAWAFSKLLGDDVTRRLASACLIAAAIGFVASGAGVLMQQAWWQPVIVSAAAFSAVIYFLFWDGTMRRWDDQGWIGNLINVAILVAVLVLKWPDFEF